MVEALSEAPELEELKDEPEALHLQRSNTGSDVLGIVCASSWLPTDAIQDFG
jgi:hypothetical protein